MNINCVLRIFRPCSIEGPEEWQKIQETQWQVFLYVFAFAKRCQRSDVLTTCFYSPLTEYQMIRPILVPEKKESVDSQANQRFEGMSTVIAPAACINVHKNLTVSTV